MEFLKCLVEVLDKRMTEQVLLGEENLPYNNLILGFWQVFIKVSQKEEMAAVSTALDKKLKHSLEKY